MESRITPDVIAWSNPNAKKRDGLYVKNRFLIGGVTNKTGIKLILIRDYGVK
jgi:hypothetical protein